MFHSRGINNKINYFFSIISKDTFTKGVNITNRKTDNTLARHKVIFLFHCETIGKEKSSKFQMRGPLRYLVGFKK